jgi:large subunit ribosomal protein L15
MAGSGKQAATIKPSIWKDKKFFGKYGFKRNVRKKEINVINVRQIEVLEKDGKVDLTKQGFHKLLGTGKVTKKIKVNVESATKKAIYKIKKAGGEVIMPKENVEPAEKVEKE